MYHTFTGSSRRPRQVDLSGRKANPWAPGASGGAQAALQNAQQDRQLRQRQRDELAAIEKLQRVWRGHNDRAALRRSRREEWDRKYGGSLNIGLRQDTDLKRCLTLLLSFADTSLSADIHRVLEVMPMVQVLTGPAAQAAPWPSICARLAHLCLDALTTTMSPSELVEDEFQQLLSSVESLTGLLAKVDAKLSRSILVVTTSVIRNRPEGQARITRIVQQLLSTQSETTYDNFLHEVIAKPQRVEFLQALAADIHWSTLEHALTKQDASISPRRCLWTLGNLLSLASSEMMHSLRPKMMGDLLGSCADHVDAEAQPLDIDNYQLDERLDFRRANRTPLNVFLKTGFTGLIDQDTIRGGLVQPQRSGTGSSLDLATYVFALLRVFYNHADEIRMWLYLGPVDSTTTSVSTNIITLLWNSARDSSVVKSIAKDVYSVVELVTCDSASSSAYQPPTSNRSETRIGKIADEWKVVLLFLELYSFVLKIMDDEEFLGNNISQSSNSRSNPLSIRDVAVLVTFLNHLGFSLYYQSREISQAFNPQSEPLSRQSLSIAFGLRRSITETSNTSARHPELVAGLAGVSIDYVKNVVTGLVRAIYERDSRRHFLPKGHWLMTSVFDMAKFVNDVVAEEEHRRQVHDMDDDDDAGAEDDVDPIAPSNLLTTNTRRLREMADKERAQRKASRRRYLESVAPRLEILQNMPFIIPFDVRVQLFRAFVRMDQAKRRNGFVDPETWRQSLFASNDRNQWEQTRQQLQRHHAKVRRKHEFQDAMDQFYDLGAGLKEPIQITFVDEFDMAEAGIDGGGVTKEFLTSATDHAFRPRYGLFESTAQHQLYVNPTALEELQIKLAGMDFDDGESVNDHIRETLHQFEFAGRVIGKCLYEGILVDITFAGFFLNKWAVANEDGNISAVTGYNANMNDLRDLDEELYQGLLSLKNYQGDAEDLALSFTIADEIPLGDGTTKTIERNLIPNGADTAVRNDNKLVYISSVARYRLHVQSYHQTKAFLKGLACIVEPSWLAMFNQSELQTLIGGTASSIDVEDLRRNTVYGGLYVIGDDGLEHPSVELFWKVMHELSGEDKGRVLKFVTSTPRAPLLGFGTLMPKFSIRDSGTDESRLPSTSTCVNLLKLPRYSSKDVLKEKLIYAVNSGAGFDLS